MRSIDPGLRGRWATWVGARTRKACLTALLFGAGRAAALEPAAPSENEPDATRDATVEPARPSGEVPPSERTQPPKEAQAPRERPPAPSPPPAPAEHVETAEAALARRLLRLAPAGAAPCALHATLEQGRQTLVACGAAGVWVVELDGQGPDRLIERRSVEGRAVGLFARNGRVWIEIETLSARPLELGDGRPAPGVERDAPARPLAPPSPPAPAQPAPKLDVPIARPVPRSIDVAILGRVVSSRGGRLVVDLGRRHGVRVGNRVELAAVEESPFGPFREREVIAVGRVTSVADEQSLVEVGIGEEVPVGAEVALTAREPTSHRTAPPRVAGIWSLAGVLRPFFVLDRLGFGALNELSVSYQTQGPLRVQLVSSPLAFSTADDGSSFSATALGLVSYDTRLFEIGIGAGAQTVNDSDYEPGSGLTLSQSLRFGSLDGLNLSVRNDISLFHSEFDYSAFNGAAQVPVSDRGWLVLQGGGGSVGYGFVEIGGKLLLFGNGTRDSLFLRGTIGYAALYREPGVLVIATAMDFDAGVDHAGPLVGFGVEYRM